MVKEIQRSIKLRSGRVLSASFRRISSSRYAISADDLPRIQIAATRSGGWMAHIGGGAIWYNTNVAKVFAMAANYFWK